MTTPDSKVLRLLKEAHKKKWEAPLGKRLCKLGCKKILRDTEFNGTSRRCIDCTKEFQHQYHLKRQAAKYASGWKPSKRGPKPK